MLQRGTENKNKLVGVRADEKNPREKITMGAKVSSMNEKIIKK